MGGARCGHGGRRSVGWLWFVANPLIMILSAVRGLATDQATVNTVISAGVCFVEGNCSVPGVGQVVFLFIDSEDRN